MKIKSGIFRVVAVIGTLGLTSQAWGACNVDLDEEGNPVTGAASAYELSGQGNISCADLNMFDITSTATLGFSSDGKQLDTWATTVEADAVLIKPSNGNRCVYNYPTIAKSGQLLTPGSTKSISEVRICSDGRTGIAEPVVVEPEVLPVTTATNSCNGDILANGQSLIPGSTPTLVTAESLDGQFRAACNAAGTGQSYCEDRCVNPRDVGESPACLGSLDPLTGEYGLEECQPCDTALDVIAQGGNPPLHPLDGSPNAGLPMEFCWEKTGSVYEGVGDLSDPVDPPQINGYDRSAGTMIKHTPIRQSESSTTWFNYCYKTSVAINGRYYWVTTCR
jgi:hypothetical protein